MSTRLRFGEPFDRLASVLSRALAGLNHFVYDVTKLFQARQGDDNRIAATPDLFGDS